MLESDDFRTSRSAERHCPCASFGSTAFSSNQYEARSWKEIEVDCSLEPSKVVDAVGMIGTEQRTFTFCFSETFSFFCFNVSKNQKNLRRCSLFAGNPNFEFDLRWSSSFSAAYSPSVSIFRSSLALWLLPIRINTVDARHFEAYSPPKSPTIKSNRSGLPPTIVQPPGWANRNCFYRISIRLWSNRCSVMPS